jgi:heme A synthase
LKTLFIRIANRVDKLARYAFILLALIMAFGVVGGAIAAFTWKPFADATDLAGPLYSIQALAFFHALMFVVPSLLFGIWDLTQGRQSRGSRRLLAFFGPVMVVMGTEVLSHLFIPCGWLDGLCDSDGGIKGRWHQLHHTLVMGVPLLLLYWLALSRWYPALLRPQVSG